MYYVMRASAPSLHRESTDSLIPGRQHDAHEFLTFLLEHIYDSNKPLHIL